MTTEPHPPDSPFAGFDCPVQTLKTVLHEENAKKPGPARIAEWLSKNTKSRCKSCHEKRETCEPFETRLYCSNTTCRNSGKTCSRVEDEVFDRVCAQLPNLTREQFQHLKDEPWQKNISVAASTSSTFPPTSLTIVDDLSPTLCHVELNSTPTIPKKGVKKVRKFLPFSPDNTAYAVSLAIQKNILITDLKDRLQEKEEVVMKLAGTLSFKEKKIAELEAKLSKAEAEAKIISTPPVDEKLRQELTAALAQTEALKKQHNDYAELMQGQLNDKESVLRSSASELDQAKKQLSDTQRVAETEIQDIRRQASDTLSEKAKYEAQVKSLLRKIDSKRDLQQQRDIVDYLHISAHCKRLLDAAADFEQQSDSSKCAVTVIKEHVEALANITERNSHSIPLDFNRLNNILKLRERDEEKLDGEESYSTELHEPSAKRMRLTK